MAQCLTFPVEDKPVYSNSTIVSSLEFCTNVSNFSHTFILYKRRRDLVNADLKIVA